MKILQELQELPELSTADITTKTIVPALIIPTAVATLKQMGIECIVAEGESDTTIAALSIVQCLVLTLTSSFLIWSVDLSISIDSMLTRMKMHIFMYMTFNHSLV